MRLTIRGWTAVAVVAFALAMSWQYGPRSLNAVVVPVAIVTVAALFTTARIDPPTVEGAAVDDGFVGETRTVERTIESPQTASGTIHATVGDGLSAQARARLETTLEGDAETRFTYELSLEARGEHDVGRLEITVTDVLGLVERRFEYESTDTVVAYPQVYGLEGRDAGRLTATAVAASRTDRGEFDGLREYRRGDSLRDVHWKSAAKRPDEELFVMEYADHGDDSAVTVAASAPSGREDELASAAASVVVHLLEAGLDVGLELPNAARSAGSGWGHRQTLLAALAVADAGDLEDRVRADADVVVDAAGVETTVVVDGAEIPFDRLRGEGTSGGPVDASGRGGGDERSERRDDGSRGVAA
ncbi:DUF58 domain-containing protein [Natrialba sp. INN-245]|uniref:DUF58 domain-containing protein n=1 Tax=Natrialba sp. INN-245 TaxID=2690967 RepID=UPI001310F57E|nr:DUF58 domain-containing protein [Natrialba sp. INN-245]MWV38664.1 DUF58 domain-containing protein [Natrialba sp. INN-245]